MPVFLRFVSQGRMWRNGIYRVQGEGRTIVIMLQRW